MNIERNDLAHEFPQHKEKIHGLKMSNAHFSKLFDAYHALTNDVERLEGEGVPVADDTLEAQKKERAFSQRSTVCHDGQLIRQMKVGVSRLFYAHLRPVYAHKTPF